MWELQLNFFRSFPINFILLATFTITEGVILGMVVIEKPFLLIFHIVDTGEHEV